MKGGKVPFSFIEMLSDYWFSYPELVLVWEDDGNNNAMHAFFLRELA